jgi:PP-loop superfamily ATP-utilizing enzyme
VEVAEDLQSKLAENREVIAEGIRKLGFAQVDFDEEGFVSGKLNRVIDGVNAGK